MDGLEEMSQVADVTDMHRYRRTDRRSGGGAFVDAQHFDSSWLVEIQVLLNSCLGDAHKCHGKFHSVVVKFMEFKVSELFSDFYFEYYKFYSVESYWL
jgi:hypothetical protein